MSRTKVSTWFLGGLFALLVLNMVIAHLHEHETTTTEQARVANLTPEERAHELAVRQQTEAYEAAQKRLDVARFACEGFT